MQVYPRTGIAEYAHINGFTNTQITEFPATFYEDSIVSIPDKEKRGRLRALFALGSSLNLPVALLRLLMELPLRKSFEYVDRLWKGYCLRFRIYPYKQNPASFVRDVRTYLGGKYY